MSIGLEAYTVEGLLTGSLSDGRSDRPARERRALDDAQPVLAPLEGRPAGPSTRRGSRRIPGGRGRPRDHDAGPPVWHPITVELGPYRDLRRPALAAGLRPGPRPWPDRPARSCWSAGYVSASGAAAVRRQRAPLPVAEPLRRRRRREQPGARLLLPGCARDRGCRVPGDRRPSPEARVRPRPSTSAADAASERRPGDRGTVGVGLRERAVETGAGGPGARSPRPRRGARSSRSSSPSGPARSAPRDSSIASSSS